MIETAAQIDFLLDQGIPLSHIDSHGHLHKFKPFRLALSEVMKERGLKRVRNIQDLYLKRPLKSPTYWLGPLWRKELMKSFTTTDHFYMCASEGGDNWPQALVAKLPSTGTLEVGVHPGYNELWRAKEHQAIQDFSNLARANGHQLITWDDIVCS